MKSRSRIVTPLIIAAGLLPFAETAIANTVDFSSTATSGFNWSTGSNWVGGTAPVNDTTTDIARFNQTSYANGPTGSSASISGIVVGDGTTNTAALNMAIHLTLGANGINIASNTGAFTFSPSYNSNLILAANQVWNSGSSNLFIMRGLISGAYGIEKTGSGAIALDGRANTFSGGFKLTEGNLRLGHDAAMGTGTLTLNGGVLSAAGSSHRTINNAIHVTGNTTFGITGTGGLVTMTGPVSVSNNGKISYVNAGGAITGNVTLNSNLTLDSSIGSVLAAPTGQTPALTVGGNTIAGVISDGSGSFGITKTGTGVVALTGMNTFTGNITINQGTLSITNAFIADTASVSLLSGSIFNLNFSGTDTIAGLYLAGLAQAEGTYGAVGSGATFTSSFFTGAGILNVTASAVPEPSTYAVLGGLAALGLAAWRRPGTRR